MMSTKNDRKRNLIVLAIFNFGISSYWMVENFWINLYWTRNIDPHVSYVGLMVALSAVVGVITQIIFGAISDSSTSKYGRRKLLMLIGSVTGGISMCFFPLTRTFSVILVAITYGIILDALITFFGDLTTPTRLAFLAENTEIEKRGSVNAILGLTVAASTVMVIAVSGYIVDFAGPDFAFYFGGIALIICGIVFFAFADDPPLKSGKNGGTWRDNIKRTFTMESYQQNKSFYHLLLFLFICTTGAQVIAPFIFIYIETDLGLGGLELALTLGGVGLMSFLISFPMGFLMDKKGRKPIMFFSILGACVFSILFIFVPARQEVTFIYTFLIGGFMMGFSAALAAASETWMQDLAPEDRRGSLLGYRMAAVVIPMVPGALIGGFIADYAIKPEGYVYSPLMFLVSALILLASLPVLKFISETLVIGDKAEEEIIIETEKIGLI